MKSLVILNNKDRLDEALTTLDISSEEAVIFLHEYPIIVQPFDNLIRTLLLKIIGLNITNVYFVIDEEKLNNESITEWLSDPKVVETIELFDYLKLPGSEAINTWFNSKNIEADLDKSISLLKMHPLLPKNVSYFYKLLDNYS